MAHEPASGEYEVQARNWQGGTANVAQSHALTPHFGAGRSGVQADLSSLSYAGWHCCRDRIRAV